MPIAVVIGAMVLSKVWPTMAPKIAPAPNVMTPISDEPSLTFDSASEQMNERTRSISLTVRSGQYDRLRDYHLVAVDVQTKVEVLRLPVRIDLAFSNDF